jgi:tetratricopeptide (TPR) repeat protein
MRLARGVVLALVFLAPAAVAAQTRPSNTMHTNSASLYFERARRSNREDEKKELLEKALNFALEGIKAKADNPRAYLLAGQINVQLGHAAVADSMFDKAEQLWPEYAKETENERLQLWIKEYNAGIIAVRDNKMTEAVQHFEQADAVYAKRPGARINLAQLYARTRQPDKAIAAYKGALEIMRGPSRQGLKADEEKQWKELEEAATFNLAQLYALTGKNEEALTAYRELIARDPNNAVAKSNMAVVLRTLNRADEASKIYNELLSADLSATEYFNVGVGLFRSSQFEPAANAFRKALSKNPQMRDAQYNMAQALYSLSSELEEQKSKAEGAAAKPIETRLIAVFTELGELTAKLRTIDPANRNVIALQSRAYRALGDLTAADVRASTDWKNKTLEVLKANEALNFEVSDVSMTAAGEEVQISGIVVNLKGNAGAPVKLRIHFLGANGAPLGSQDATVALPAVQGAAPFKVAFKTTAEVLGWRYEILP